MNKLKIIRVTTVPISLKTLLKGQLRFINNYFDVIGVTSSGPEIEELKKEEGIRVHQLKMTRKITPLQDIVSLWKLYRFLKREKPPIIHSHTPKAGMVSMISGWFAGVPVRMHTVAGLPLMETKGFKRKLLILVEKVTYFCATNIYPNSMGLKSFIVDHNLCNENKLKVIGNGSSNGINIDFFSRANFSDDTIQQLKTDLSINDTDFVFIFVGRLVADKGVNELISAFKQLNASNAKLLLVGNYEQELDPLQEVTLEEIEKNPNIVYVGYQPDVRPYFSISNCLAFPSYREGFPNVVMQAAAMGLPCIVSDINGCNEIIINKSNGLIVPPKNVQELLQSMREILFNKILQHQLSEKSRQMIVERYNQNLIWEELLKEYKRLADV